jgi:hypothetical protein
MFILQTLIVTILALIPFGLAFKKNPSLALRLAAFFGVLLGAVNFALLYFGCFSTAYVMWGGIGFLCIAEMIGMGLICMGAMSAYPAVLAPGALLFLVFIVLNIPGCEMINAKKYASLAGKIEERGMKQWMKDNQPIDENNIRLVPESLAIANATLVMSDGGAIGSSYDLAVYNITLQKIRERYYYLIPLGYKSFGRWTSLSSIGKYVRVSATDPYAKAELVAGRKMRFSPSAFFGEELTRHIYTHGYSGHVIDDILFEEDDRGGTWWVVTITKPTIASWGAKAQGVLVVDPESGNITPYGMGNVPAWVDRVIPEHLVASYLSYWGDLKDGWWNSVWSGKNLMEPETPVLNYTADGRCMFVTPMTSTSLNDNTMIGIVYTDARTGESVMYQVPGGATEEALAIAVNAAVAYKRWHASSQMVYENIFGNLSALVPILSEGGNYQGLAIVETQNKRVAYGATPQEALREFERILATTPGPLGSSAAAKEVRLESVVTRIGWDLTQSGKQYYFMLANSTIMFMGTSNVLSITKEGDRVAISYMSNAKGMAPVVSFRNLTLGK